MGGQFTTVGGVTRNRIARLNPDGTLDASYNPNANNAVYSLALQGDGKIVLGGDFTTVGATARNRLVRLNPDASIDGFNPNANGRVSTMVMQADGKIVLGGNFTTIGVTTRNNSARLNGDGSLDTNFNPNVSSTVQGAAAQADGKVILVGNFTTVGGLNRTNVARLQNVPATQSLTVPGANRIEWLRGGSSPEAQSVAFDFSTDGGANWIVLGAGVRISGGWELTGFSLPPSGQVRARARLNGGNDNGSSGLVEATTPFSGFTASAPLVTTGSANTIRDFSATLAASINPGGLATTAQFEYGTTTSYGSVVSITLAPTNGATAQNVSVPITGLTPDVTYHFRALASNSAGLTLGNDATFTTLLLPQIVVEQPVGTNLVDGVATNIFGLGLVGTTNPPVTYTIRNLGLTNLTGLVITKDGVHSNDFTVNTNAMSTTLAPGGTTTFTVAFGATAFGSRTAAIHIANNDLDENPFDLALLGSGYRPGDVETNLIIGTGNTVYSVAVQADGKILLGGPFATFGAVTRNNLARLNADGSLDTGFNPNPLSEVDSLVVQPDGKILVGGLFSTITSVTRNRLARVNTDGSLDAGFNPNITGTAVYAMAFQPDGKILVGGDFTAVGGTARNRLARLNADGSLDTGFNPNANNTVRSISVQADGKIVVGGLFTAMGASSRTNVARLNADGTVDSGFTTVANSSVYCTAVQTDGKILIGGFFTTVNGTARTSFARLNADGTLDTGYNPAPNSTVYGLSLQANGKLIVSGNYTSIASTTRNRIARLNADGTLDTTFNPDAGGVVYGAAIQADGMVILGGNFSTVGGLARTNLARLFNDPATQSLSVPSPSRIEWLRGGASPEAANVAFDLSTDGGANWIPLGAGVRISGGWEFTTLTLPASGQVRGRAQLPSGTHDGSSGLSETNAAFSGFTTSAPLVSTGGASNITDVLATLYASINPAGAATTARFEYGTTTSYGLVAAITLSPTNGATTQTVSTALGGLTPGTTYHYRVAASNSVGTTFGSDATFETLLYPDIAVEQPAGTNLVDGVTTNNFGLNLLGTSNAPRAFIIRNVGLTNLTGLVITRDGVHSNDFIVDTTGMSTALAPGASTTFNVIFATGATGTRTAAIHIANNDPDENPFDLALTGFGYVPGDVETNFNPSATGGSGVYGLAIQPDGKTIAGGDFTAISSPARSMLARLNLDGTVDPPFTNANGAVQCALVQPDGKVVIGGDFTTVAGVSRTRIARLNTNGTLDMSFSNNVNSTINGLALQPDGKILIAGQFTIVSGLARPSMTRLNADGSLDSSFAATTANQNVSCLALLPDGRIMIGGFFWTVGGVSRTNLARLNSNGTLDVAYTNRPNATVYSLAVQPDGKVIMGGSFTAVNGVTRNRFARFNADDTLDSLDLNANNDVYGIALQADGKIVVGGSFFNVKGSTTRNNIARLNADGTLDSFNPNSGSTVYGLAIQSDGKILVGGGFTTMNGTVTRNRIARLLNDGATQSLTAPAANRIEWLRGGASPETLGVAFDLSTDGGVNWTALGDGVRISGGWELTGLTLPASGQVRGRARMSGGRNNGSSSLLETAAPFSGFVSSPPLVTTTAATNVIDVSATLTATINPAGSATTARFEYGLTTSYGSVTNITLSPATGATTQNVSAVISGLTPGALYHFRAVATNSAGETAGGDLTFTTLLLPEIAVAQPAGTNLVDGVSTNNFGTNLMAVAGPPRTFVISNLGAADLVISAITKDGTHAADFTVDTNGINLVIAPGASTTFTVTFTPGTNTVRTAALHILNNDLDESSFDIALAGTGYKGGDLDLAFNPNASDFVRATAVQVDGKIVVLGIFTQMGGMARTNVARLNADGTLDTGFNPRPDSSVDAVTLESNRKILLGGFFTNVSGQARTRLARLNADGSADLALNSGANSSVYSIVPQPDGKLILCGNFTNVAGQARNRIARLNTDGSVDSGFNPNADSSVSGALLQTNGQIIVWGNFDNIGGSARHRIARLNTNGTVESVFNPNPDISVYCATLQADGRILVGGDFTAISGLARNRLARLNTDGTADSGFNPNASESVSSIALQADGRIVVGGNFTQMGGVARLYLARVNANGTLDGSFNPNPLNTVSSVALQTDGKILVGGSFTTIGGVTRNRLARLLNDNATESLTVPNANRIEWLRGGTMPEAMAVSFDVSIDGGTTWIPLGAGSRINGGWERAGLNLPASGQVRGQALVTGGSGNATIWVAETVTNFSGLPAPEIAVEQPAGAILADGGSRDFGAVLLGGGSNLTFTITNSGNADLTGLIVTKDGAHGADFTVNTNGLGATLSAGASANFTVTFTPGALGARSAALHIANNDIDENPFDIALTGTGIAPEIVVEQPAGTGLINGAAAINFGSLVPGASSVAKTFIISNSGSSTLSGLAVTVDGANPGDFAVNDSDVPASLIPGGSATFSVTFTPPLAGSRSAALHIASDDADENPFNISLTGTGANQTPVVAYPIPDQSATATLPFSHTFPPNTFTDPDAGQTLTLTATRTSGAALPAWLTFTAATRTFSGTPSPGDVGTLSVRVTATDSGTPPLSASDEFDIVIAPIAPAVTTLPETSVGAYGATLHASINPNGLTTTAQFEYGTTASYGTTVIITLTPNNGTNAQTVSTVLPGLNPNTTYHFRATATNSAGGNAGIDRAFTTTPPPPGIADTNFNPSSRFGVLCLAMQPDGKILAGGDYAEINGRPYIPRLNPDGTSDLSFNPFNFSRTFTLAVQPDGKILAGGSQANAQTGINLVRLNPDGSIDNSLDPLGFNNFVWTVAPQLDGKTVVGGSFTTALGQPRNGLARINADSTLDPGFNPNANGSVYAALVLPDGKIFVCGGFTQIGGQTHNYMARLNADGTPDNTFVAGHNASVLGAALQADGKILVIKQLAFTVVYQIGRLNVDGTWDSSFNSEATHDNSVYTMAVQTDGRIVVGGDFTQMAGQSRSRLARLNSNGTIDPLFNPGPNLDVLAVTLQGDGRILVGGQFTNISSQAHMRLARLNNDAATQSLTVPTANRVQWLRGGASPEAVAVTFEMTADGGLTWVPLGAGTRISGGWEQTAFTLPPSGIIRARAQVAGGNYGNSYGLVEATAAFSGFPATAPHVTTLPATAVGEFDVTLHASVNPAGATTTAQFEYGTDTNYGSIASIPLSPDNGTSAQQVSVVVNGLAPGTHYHFRVTATNSLGGRSGSDYKFTTLGFPEISVEQPAGTTLPNGGTIAFGTNIVGAPLTKTFTITNLGTTNLAGLSISKNGANAAEFIVGTLTNLIPPGGSATFDVTFNPTPGGTKTAAIHIASNDSDENPFDINLSGFALAPEIVVESPPGTGLTSRLVACCDTVAFDWVGLGVTNSKTVLIRNIGTANLNLSGHALIGANIDQFTLGPFSATNVPPGSNATFVMYFHPTSGGPKSAFFQIFNDDSNENPFLIEMFGAGLVPDITVEQPSGAGLTDGASTVDYGSTSVGTPVVKTFVIRNSGPYDYNLTGLVVTKDGTNAADFVLGSLSSTSVSVNGASALFTVTFAPSTAGTKTAAIHIASNDPDENPFDIALTGFASGPEIVVEQPPGTDIPDGGTNSFGVVDAGGAGDLTFTIRNLGNADLTGLAITFTGANAAEFSVTANPAAPVPGTNGSTTFTVRFAPVTGGPKSAALHIANNDADENPFDINLTGVGAAPEIVVERPSGTNIVTGGTNGFGLVFLGTNVDHVFTIRNIGLRDLTGLGITIDGTNAGDFTITSAPTAPLAGPNGSTTFTVRFAPGTAGPKTAELHFASNDADENPFDIVLTGNGYSPNTSLQLTYDLSLPPFSASNSVDVLAYGRFNNDLFGSSVRAGDINGDGVDDLIVGSDRTGISSGAVYVWFGKGSLAGTKDALGTLGPLPDFVIGGANVGDSLSIDGALVVADVNGDGIADLIIGAPFADGPGESRSSAGEAYIFFGRSSPATFPPGLFLGTNAADVKIYGPSAGDGLTSGGSILVADVNGDGTNDLVFGAGGADGAAEGRSDAGEAYVVFGRASFPPILDLAVTGSTGADVTIYGATAGDQVAGGRALTSGDLNGDGVADLVLGAGRSSSLAEGRPFAGEAYIVFGRRVPALFPATLDLAVQGTNGADVTLYGADSYGYLTSGGALTTGDVNGDGVEDLLLGAASAAGPFFRNGAGAAYVIFGRSTPASFPATLDLRNHGNNGANVTLSGNDYGDNLTFGGAITAADVNGDGIKDIIVGAVSADGPENARGFAGEAYIVFGRASPAGFPLTMDMGVPGSNGANVTIYGATTSDELTYRGVLLVADVNGDGFGDLILQAEFGGGPGEARPGAGEVYVVFGRSSALFPAQIDLATQGYSGANVTIYGAEAGDRMTLSGAVAVGDVNGDGVRDILMGAAGATGVGNAREYAGEAYVLFGVVAPNSPPLLTRANEIVAVPINTTATNSGTIGDANGDSVVLSASVGTLTQGSGTWSWSYTPTVLGSQTVTITADDGHPGGTNAVTFTLTATDVTPPTAAFVPVSPDPRTNAAGTITLNFSEYVSGVNAGDFTLTRNGSPVSLAGLVITPISEASYTLDLTAFTGTPGDYVLTLVAAGSGIMDTAGNALAANASDAFGLASSSSYVSGGNFSITNVPGGGAMGLTIRRVSIGGTNFIELHDANNPIAAGAGVTQVDANTIRVPEASVTNQLQITGGSGDDHFVIDATAGCPLPPGGVNVDGGGQTLNGADTLAVIGTFSTVQYDANNPGAGVVTTACGNVNFTGLEPVDFTGAAIGSLAINVNPANLFPAPVTTTLSVMPGAGQEANTRVAFSGGLELMDFGTLTNTLTLTGDPGAVDTIIVQNVGTGFAGHLVIMAQSGDAVFLTNTTLTLGAGKNFTVTAANVTLGSATVTGGGTVSLDGGTVAMRLDGPANNQHSRLTVTGTVALAGTPALGLAGGYVPQGGDVFTLIDNDGVDAITGTLAGLPEGATLTFNGVLLQISYLGGDGNDLVLTVNTPPLVAANNATITVGEGATASNSGTFSDAQGNATVTLTASVGTVTPNNGAGAWSWSFNTSDGPDESQTVTITANDGVNLAVTTTFTLTVTNVPPAALAQSVTTSEETATNIVLTATDPGADTITNWTVSVHPLHGTLSGTGANRTYTPALNYSGSDSFQFTVTDSDGATSSEAVVSLQVVAVNDRPVLGALGNFTVNPGATISFTATVTDVDPGDVQSFSLVNPPAHASISAAGAFTWRTHLAQAGTTNSVTVVVTDNGTPNLSATNSFIVIVNPSAAVTLAPDDYSAAGFRFNVNGFAGPDYVISVSTNLTEWVDIHTNLAPALPFQFNDPSAGAGGFKTYRVRLQP